MKEHIRLSGHYALRAALFLGFSLYILYLVKTDHLTYYIAPRMIIYVKLAAIAMYAVSVYLFYAAIRAIARKPDVCEDCDHTPPRKLWLNIPAYSLFALPLLIGFATPDAAMNSALAAKKGMNLTTSASQIAASKSSEQPQASAPLSPSPSPLPSSGANATDAQLNELFKADKYTEDFARLAKKLYRLDTIAVKEEGFIETLSAIDLFTKPFDGKKIELSGFVYREDDMKPDQFVVARFQVQCCSADAAPFGVIVRSDRAASFMTDSWVKVTGTIGTTTYEGNEVIQISSNQVAAIEQPKNVYVYPNYDFLTQP